MRWIQFAISLALAMAIVSLPIAIVIALALIRLFRQRVTQSMRAAAGVPQDHATSVDGGPQGALDIELIETAPINERFAPVLGYARRQSRELAAIHAEAACVYPLVFVILWMEPFETILPMAAFFGNTLLVFGTPVVFASMMILSRQPRFLALSAGVLIAVVLAFDLALDADVQRALYVLATVPVIVVLMLMILRREPWIVILMVFGIVLAVSALILVWGGSIDRSSNNYVGFWLMAAGVPTVTVVLLNTRRLRAVGPVVFAATLLLLYGIVAGVICGAFFAAHTLGAQFVREDLAQQPFFDAVSSLSDLEMLAMARAAMGDLGSIVHYDVQNWTPWVKLQTLGIAIVLSLLGALAAWSVVRWLADSYKRRRASDQMLTIDVMMLIFVIPMSVITTARAESQIHGWLLGAIGLASFAGYKFWARWRLRSLRRRKPPGAPRPLLLLRVFGFDTRTQRLLEDVGQRWRYLGPIRLIGGPDLAYATIEPHEFFDFVNGRLSRAFVTSRKDLESRLGDAPVVPDPDGLYRVDDFFCHDDTWRMTVLRLVRDSSAILMDLRGFSPANRGCVFEIEQLIAGVPLNRVVLLADASTDTLFLEAIVREAWRTMPGDSPNAGAGRRRVRILKAGSRHRRTLKVLLGLLCEGFPENAAASPSCPAVVSREATAA